MNGGAYGYAVVLRFCLSVRSFAVLNSSIGGAPVRRGVLAIGRL